MVVVVKGVVVYSEVVRVMLVRNEVVMGNAMAHADSLVIGDRSARVKRSAACGPVHTHRDPKRPSHALVPSPSRGRTLRHGCARTPPQQLTWPFPGVFRLIGVEKLASG